VVAIANVGMFKILYVSVQVPNPCQNAACSDICLLAPNKTYTCACGENKIPSLDKHTCYGELKVCS
jgi:hypothetical protein